MIIKMNPRQLILVSLLACSPFALFADATEDLLQAVKIGNIELAKLALENGAQANTVLPSYGHSARSLAQEQLKEFIKKNQILMIASSAGFPALIITACINNPKNAFLSLLASFLPIAVNAYARSNPNGIAAQFNKSYAREIIGWAGDIGLLATAWEAKSTAGLIAACIGTVGFASAAYGEYKLQPHFEMLGLLSDQETATDFSFLAQKKSLSYLHK